MSPMSEVVDNEAVEMDPFRLAEGVARSEEGRRSFGGEVSTRRGGMVREVWDGLVEDVFGPRKGTRVF